MQFLKLARNTVSATLQPFRGINHTSSMSVPSFHCIYLAMQLSGVTF